MMIYLKGVGKVPLVKLDSLLDIGKHYLTRLGYCVLEIFKMAEEVFFHIRIWHKGIHWGPSVLL